MEFFNLKEIRKAYTEGVYADTPQNRKLGRVGMTYTQYVKKVKNSEETSSEDKVYSKRLNQLFSFPFIKFKDNEGKEYVIKNGYDWVYITKDGVGVNERGNIVCWTTQGAALRRGERECVDYIPLSNFKEFNFQSKIKEDSPMRKLYIKELEDRGEKSGVIDENSKDYKTAQSKLNSYKNQILAFNKILEKFYKDSETDYLYITDTSIIGSTIQLKPFKIEDINYGFKVISEYKDNNYSSKDKDWKKEEFEVFIVREIDESFDFDSYEIIGWEEGLASNDFKNQLKEYTKYLKKSIDVFKSDNPDVELEKE